MGGDSDKRKKYIRWITISSYATVVCLIAIVLSIAVYIVNFRPGANIVFYRDVLKSLLLIHAFGLAFPLGMIVHATTRIPPYKMEPEFENRLAIARLFGVISSIPFGIALTAAAFTCKTIYVNAVQMNPFFQVAACIQPLVWISFGFCLYQYRNTLEGRGKTYAGIGALAFTLGGAAICSVVLSVLVPSLDLGLLTLLIPPLATGLLFVGLVSTFFALRFTRREFMNYLY